MIGKAWPGGQWLALFAALAAGAVPADPQPAQYGVRLLAAYDHDPSAFTQGLVYYRGYLYESTGRYGASSIRKVVLETGEVIAERALPDRYFGEGLTVVGDRLVQLTWRERTGFIYDPETLALLETFHYPTEGWGLAYDGTWLVMSDGSATLYRLDPETFGIIGTVRVKDWNGPVERLNELEMIRGRLYANVWQEDRIAEIDPSSGRVTAWIDLSAVAEKAGEDAGVLNGIAYDDVNRRILVTGKLWPKLLAIDMVKN